MSDRCQPLRQINEIGFAVDDLSLYLDAHPTDDRALDAFSQAVAQREQLLDSFVEEYRPLTLNCVCPETDNKSEPHTKYPGQRHSTWSDGPFPQGYPERQNKEVPNHVDL